MLQLGRFGDDAALLGRAEHLLKMQRLPLVGQIEDLVGVIILHALHERREVGRCVKRRAVGLDEDAGRKLLLIALLRHVDDPRALALAQDAHGLEPLKHRRDIRLGVALALPDVEADVQVLIVALEVGDGDAHDLLPEGIVAAAVRLKLGGGGVRLHGDCHSRGLGVHKQILSALWRGL